MFTEVCRTDAAPVEIAVYAALDEAYAVLRREIGDYAVGMVAAGAEKADAIEMTAEMLTQTPPPDRSAGDLYAGARDFLALQELACG